jgi:hypothetical protein
LAHILLMLFLLQAAVVEAVVVGSVPVEVLEGF